MTPRIAIIELAIMASLGFLLALLGPFGSFAVAGFAERLVYWVGLSVAGWAIYRPAMMVGRALAIRLDLPEAATWAGACLVANLPMTLIVWLASFRHTPRRWPSLSNFADMYGPVLIIGAAITIIFWYRRVPLPVAAPNERKLPLIPSAVEGTALSARPSTALGMSRAGGADANPRFLDRLPSHLGRDLLALEMEDHYVRAHTALGSTLILLRMRDAVAELAGLAGAQVHRSWWVARTAVSGGETEGRNRRLRLTNGLVVPVARAAAPGLTTDGWPI